MGVATRCRTNPYKSTASSPTTHPRLQGAYKEAGPRVQGRASPTPGLDLPQEGCLKQHGRRARRKTHNTTQRVTSLHHQGLVDAERGSVPERKSALLQDAVSLFYSEGDCFSTVWFTAHVQCAPCAQGCLRQKPWRHLRVTKEKSKPSP